jgi:hypothetical protein
MYKHPSKRTSRHVAVRASSDPQQGPQAQKLFQQHKVLLEAGFSYDQAALILSVCQQRKGSPSQLTSAGAVNSLLQFCLFGGLVHVCN